MSKLKEAIVQGEAGEPIDPSYLEDEPVDQMASRYAEVFHAFASQPSPYVRLSNWPGELHQGCKAPDTDTPPLIRKLIAKVPGVVRFDGCCDKCGENEFHTAGWTNDDAGDAARAEARKRVSK
jgi:hypothetical protein